MQDHTREELKTYLFRGDVNGVNKLLESGDIESPDQMIDLFNDGIEGTVLIWACWTFDNHNDISLIRDLVKKHNANVDAQGADFLQATAVHIAIILGLERVLRFLVEEGHANLELRTRNGSTALHLACGSRSSNEDMVQCLLDNHADVNAVCEKGCTSLHNAAFRGNFSFVRLLLADNRVNVEATNENGRTPLHFACQKGNTETVEVLLSNGANPNAVEHKRGRTPLLYAVDSKSTACIEVLIKAKVDVNKADCNGHTALHIAVAKGSIHMVELLLKANADWSAKDNVNRIPIDMVKAEHKVPVESVFVDTLVAMVQQYQVFRDTIIRGVTQETCSLKTLQPDVVPHIAGYCDIPMGDALEKIRFELDRLRPVRRRAPKGKRQT